MTQYPTFSTWTVLVASITMLGNNHCAWSLQSSLAMPSSPLSHSSSSYSLLALGTTPHDWHCHFQRHRRRRRSFSMNMCSSRSGRSATTSSPLAAALSGELFDEDYDDQRRILLPPRRVKIRARAAASTSTTTTTTTSSTTKSKTAADATVPDKKKKKKNGLIDNFSPSSCILNNNSNQRNKNQFLTPPPPPPRIKSGALYQHQEMLDHTLLSREEELVLGRQVVRARIVREKMEELFVRKEEEKRLRRERLQDEFEDMDENIDGEEEGNANLDYDFLSYELEYLSVYGYRRNKEMMTTAAAVTEEEMEEDADKFALGGYDLDDDLLFEHSMHRSQHYSQLRRDGAGGSSVGRGGSGSSRTVGRGIEEEESYRDEIDGTKRRRRRFGPKRTGYRNGSTSSTNRNSYSSLLHFPLHKLDDTDVRTLLDSVGDMMDAAVIVEPGIHGGDGEYKNERVVLVNILLEGAYARETLMRRNVKLVMSIAKNWMRNSFTTANANNIPGDSGGGGGGGSGGSGKRSDKSSKRYLAQMYEGSWDKPSLDEAVQEGMLGLARAVDKFDPERGLRFSTYATHWVTSYVRVCFQRAVTGCLRVPSQLHDIRAAYNQIVKDHLHLGSTPPAQESIAQQLNISAQRLHIAIRATGTLLSVDAPVTSGGSSGSYKGSMAGGDGRNSQELLLLDTLKCAEPRPDDQVEISFLRQCLENAMATELTPYERDILRLRLGLDSGEGKTVREIVELSGNIVSMADVRSAERRAFKKLRSPSSVHTHNLLAYLDLASIQGGGG